MSLSHRNFAQRQFNVFHPSDFSIASEVAFAHALKIALQAHAHLDIMHIERDFEMEGPCWVDFPAVRRTLARWGILPEGIVPEEVVRAGLRVRKVLAYSKDPVERMLHHLRAFPPDLIVLATHQRQGVDRWLHRAVAEPVARRSGAMTLFVPRHGTGFVSRVDGSIELKKILLPVDASPHPQIALDKAILFANAVGCHWGECRVLHVGDSSAVPSLDLTLGCGWSYEFLCNDGDVLSEIRKADEAWSPDLIVLATAGHSDFLDALRGSTTERVLRVAHCPVLAIPVHPARTDRMGSIVSGRTGLDG